METLPIDSHLVPISELITQFQNIVIKASPGSGKTTRIPPYLNKFFKKIVVLEPRRIAAISASHRIAAEQEWVLGKKIGYHVRFDKKYDSQTEIIFLTEALLARKLLAEEDLNKIDLIILDEFHERNLWTDLCIGIIKEWQELGSPIKLMILSATLDTNKIKTYLPNCHIYQLELPKYPLETIYSKTPFKLTFDNHCVNKIIESVKTAVTKQSHQILVFLPGQGEINKIKNQLLIQAWAQDYHIEVLHGNLSLSEQSRIIENNSYEKNIILSTNIAESSVTIQNLNTVIDSGLIKISDFDFKTSTQELNLRKISLASAHQRQGRAHRQGPGTVYKLWMPMDEKSMTEYSVPEILRSDLTLPLLFLSHLGVSSDHYFSQFSWFYFPSKEVLQNTTEELISKKLISSQKPTSLGLLLLNLNIEYHFGLILLVGNYFNILYEASVLVALLQEKDILPDSQKEMVDSVPDYFFSDLILRFEIFSRKPHLYKTIESVAKSLKQNFLHQLNSNMNLKNMKNIFDILDPGFKITSVLEQIRFIIDYVFIENLQKRRKEGKNKDLSFLNTAVNKFGTESAIYETQFKSLFYSKNEYFLSLKNFKTPKGELVSSWVHFISYERIELLLKSQIQITESFDLNKETQKVFKTKNILFKNLILKSIEGLEVGLEDKGKVFQSVILKDFETFKQKIPSLNLFFRRLSFLMSIQKIPVTTSFNWRSIVADVCLGEQSLEDVINKDWFYFITNHLPMDLAEIFTIDAPLVWEDKICKMSFHINYENNEAQLESKLQHFFGIKIHPSIGRTKYNLKIILLGPNGRPIQITKDLIGFWKSSYPEIRKEMRGRYPRHAWPEDPTVEIN